MNNLIKDIFRLTELSILTPNKLLENIHLTEYKKINFEKKDGNIECTLFDSSDESTKYLYIFDFENKLLSAEILMDDEKIELFNRKKELDGLLEEYKSIKKNIAQ